MKVWFVNSLVFIVALCLAVPCYGLGTRPQFDVELLAKAETDECFNGIGEPYKPGPVCSEGERPKANQSYLWGMAKSGNTIWIATGSNMLCIMPATAATMAGNDVEAFEGDLWTCEYAEGQYPQTELSVDIPPLLGDFRPPKIYTYDLNTRVLTDKTKEITAPQTLLTLENTRGLRSAGTFGNVVFLAGPVGMNQGVNLIAFNTATGQLIGSRHFDEYSNIRRWIVLGNNLYTAVGNTAGGGTVLRWTGTETAPFSFEAVGHLDADGAEIAAHNGRIYVGTWPQEVNGPAPGLWQSPVVPDGGLTSAHANAWEKVWQADQYEPDPALAQAYGMGAMISYGGYLYWGTMHVQSYVFAAIIDYYDIGVLGMPSAFFKVWRAVSIFRAPDFDTDDSVELVYGDAKLPVYIPTAMGGYWVNRPNNMGGVSGKYGSSGFGNKFNNYIWTMAVYKDQLFVGTMDNSYLWLDWENLVSRSWLDDVIDIPWLFTPRDNEYGGDVYRFPSADDPAVRLTGDGFGNFTNYGLRTVVVDEATGLYYGTANPANLAQDDEGNPIGGWELIKVTQE